MINDNDNKLKTMGIQQREGKWILTGGLGKVFIGEPTFELDFEESFGNGQCRPGRSGVSLSSASKYMWCIWGK